MRVLPLVAALAVMPGAAFAAPAADVVVVWAPGQPIGPIERAAQKHGAAVIDRSPGLPPPVETAKFLQRGIEAYTALKFDEAQAALDQARDVADRTGAAGLTNAQLSDVFLYRGLVRAAQDDPTAWDEIVTAITVYPTRRLDTAQYSPKVAELVERAKEDVLHKRSAATLQIDAPPGCTVYVDASAIVEAVSRPTGPHWVRVACADHAPWSQRIDLTTMGAHLRPELAAYAPPSDADLLVQARAASAKALLAVEVHGDVATVRMLGADGHERDRRSVKLAGDVAPLAKVVDDMLVPPVLARQHWYQSKWAWAAGAAVLTAAVLVPVTAAIAGDTGAKNASIRPAWPMGLPW